jgi:predicted amino acid-binding ACT domain protein
MEPSLQRITNVAVRDMLAMGALLETPSNDTEEVQQFRTKVTADRKKLRALLQQQLQQA